MVDIAPIKGLIELQDDFTGRLGLAEAALGNFTAKNQESLKAVAGAVGIATGAIVAMAVATVELGKRGAEVNDVNDTLIHFAGGAKEANAAMQALREGTKGTVDNFTLAKDAAHLLSAGVKLTADDFGVLAQASFVLQNRGLGGTKEQLELVSDALVTGRTKALAMSLGVIENTNAEEDFAKKLGITKDQLSDSGKAEAHRVEVMRLLSAAVKDAGKQERDFGEEFEFAQAQVQNWIDDLGSAIAKSEVFKAGLKGIEDAVGSAFGSDKGESIKKITGFIEQGAIKVVGFAQAAITMVKVVEGAWNGVRTVVLGFEDALVTLAEGVIGIVETAAKGAKALGLISKDTVQSLDDLHTNLDGMRQSFNQQTAEAAKGVLGHTAFDDTLDKLGKTLGDVKASMLSAKDATSQQTATVDVAAKNAKMLAATQEELNKKFIDTTKVQAALEKSTRELSQIWSEYYAQVAKDSGTSAQAQEADIEAVFQKNVASLDKLDPLYKQKYAAYRAIADESLKAIASDWDSVKDKSQEALEGLAEKALNTYEQMQSSSLHFSRDVMEEQYNKWLQLRDAARGLGDSVSSAVNEAVAAIKILDISWVTDADIAAAQISKTTVMVRTLSGEVISLEEAQKRQQAGFSYQTETIDQFTIDTTPGGADALLDQLFNLSGMLDTMKSQIHDFDSQKNYFEALARFNALRDAYNLLISQAKKKHPKLASGGIVGDWGESTTVELHRREMVIPLDSSVGKQTIANMTLPRRDGPTLGDGGGGYIINHFNIDGTSEEAARKIMSIMMRQLKQTRQFGSA